MRQRKQVQKGKKPKKKTEPLAEGIIPLNARGQRDWKSMSDEELVEYARGLVKDKGIGRRVELKRADQSLYVTLRGRGLLDRIGLESSNSNHRDWKSMSDEEIVGYAWDYLKKERITTRQELDKADGGLTRALRKRGLIDQAPFLKRNVSAGTGYP